MSGAGIREEFRNPMECERCGNKDAHPRTKFALLCDECNGILDKIIGKFRRQNK